MKNKIMAVGLVLSLFAGGSLFLGTSKAYAKDDSVKNYAESGSLEEKESVDKGNDLVQQSSFKSERNEDEKHDRNEKLKVESYKESEKTEMNESSKNNVALSTSKNIDTDETEMKNDVDKPLTKEINIPQESQNSMILDRDNSPVVIPTVDKTNYVEPNSQDKVNETMTVNEASSINDTSIQNSVNLVAMNENPSLQEVIDKPNIVYSENSDEFFAQPWFNVDYMSNPTMNTVSSNVINTYGTNQNFMNHIKENMYGFTNTDLSSYHRYMALSYFNNMWYEMWNRVTYPSDYGMQM